MIRRFIVLIAVFCIGLVAPVAGEMAASHKSDVGVFDEVWRLVNQHFYDPAFRGQNWAALRDQYRPLAEAAPDEDAQARVINDMLAELGASHTGRYRPDDPAYYQLLDIFSGPLHRELHGLFPDGVRYPGIGIFTRRIGDKLFVSGTIAGLPADKAGILVGDEILDIDGKTFKPVGSFTDKVGATVTMHVRRSAGGPVMPITIKPAWIEPAKAFLDAMSEGARLIDSGGKKIGYVRIWSYAGDGYQDQLEELLSGKLKDADALIWDLRDGWGGAQPYYLDIFDKLGPTMALTERDGDHELVNVKWRKPVALLINGGSRSGKEVLAYGFKKYHVGEVIGTRTAGALLAARAYLLKDDSLLLLAVTDVAVDGERLERTGVAPTIEVPFPLEYAAGKDPQIDKAVDVLTRQIGG
ncbi:MAG TPA: S41 family peptidase [Dongiaceae bacterium]|jgi:carboxyl-terminal processing protease|nr:S41 family peptidase [Dongiaceae bacterium]